MRTTTDASDAASVGSAGERGNGGCAVATRGPAEIAHIGTERGIAARGADTNLVGGHNFGPGHPVRVRAR